MFKQGSIIPVPWSVCAPFVYSFWASMFGHILQAAQECVAEAEEQATNVAGALQDSTKRPDSSTLTVLRSMPYSFTFFCSMFYFRTKPHLLEGACEVCFKEYLSYNFHTKPYSFTLSQKQQPAPKSSPTHRESVFLRSRSSNILSFGY